MLEVLFANISRNRRANKHMSKLVLAAVGKAAGGRSVSLDFRYTTYYIQPLQSCNLDEPLQRLDEYVFIKVAGRYNGRILVLCKDLGNKGTN